MTRMATDMRRGIIGFRASETEKAAKAPPERPKEMWRAKAGGEIELRFKRIGIKRHRRRDIGVASSYAGVVDVCGD